MHSTRPTVTPGVAWRDGMRALAQYPNVYCKASGMVTEADWARWQPADFAPYLDVVFDAFSTHRVMFGSDWPMCLVAASYAQALDALHEYAQKFSPADRHKLFFANAAHFYGLETPPDGSAAQG